LPEKHRLRGGRTKVLQPAHIECWAGTDLMQNTGACLKTVLVVEDYADSRFMMARLLEMSGYRVLEAADGREAVEIAERECPDVVLMDLQMPVLDGFTATSIIRRIESICRVPVIAVSAQSAEDYLAAARRVGCDHFVTKPVDFDLLLEVVRECMEGSGARIYNAPPKAMTIRQPCV
jgi:two-component system cell cycle response regulator DivK